VTLLAFAAECRDAAQTAVPLLVGARLLLCPVPLLLIDISHSHGAQQQTHNTLRLQSNDGTEKQIDRWMDGQMHDHFIDPARLRAESTLKPESIMPAIHHYQTDESTDQTIINF